MCKVYEWIYTRVGGRPWTYIIRDNQKKYPLLYMLGFMVLGIVLGHIFW